MAATPEERAKYAKRRYDIANRWWQTSPRGAAAQAGRGSRGAELARRQQGRAQPTPTAPVARAPLGTGRPGGRFGYNFPGGTQYPGARTQMVLPTRNRLQPSPRMYFRGGQYVPGGFSGTAGRYGIPGQSPTGAFQGVAAPNMGAGAPAPRGQTFRRLAFNNWRTRDRAGRPV